MSFIFFAQPLPETNAHIRVTYDMFGNSFDLSTISGTPFTKKELQTLVAVNLGLISTSLNEQDLDFAKKGIEILTIAGSQLNDQDAYVFKRGITDVRVVLDKMVFPESPPATRACEKEKERRLREEAYNRIISELAVTRLALETTFHMFGLSVPFRLKKIAKEPRPNIQLEVLKKEFEILKSTIRDNNLPKFRRAIS